MASATATKSPKASSATSTNGASTNGNGKAAPTMRASATSVASVAPASGPTSDQFQRAADRVKMASDASRLQILHMLIDGEKFVGQMCEGLGMSQPSVSHHVALLRASGMIVNRRSGKNNLYNLTMAGRDLANAAVSLIDS